MVFLKIILVTTYASPGSATWRLENLILALFDYFLPIFILSQLVISPYSNIFDWSSGLGDRSRYPDKQTNIVTQPIVKILVR